MLVALVALGDLLPLPPPPVILSLTPEARPLTAPLTGDSPLSLASPPLTTALPIGPPPAMSSSLSVRPPTRSDAVFMALSPTAFMRSEETSLSLSIASVLAFAMASYLPEPLRERDVDFLAVRPVLVFLAGAFLAGAVCAAVFFAVALAFLAGAFFAAVFLAVELAFLAGAFFAGAFLVAVRVDSEVFEAV